MTRRRAARSSLALATLLALVGVPASAEEPPEPIPEPPPSKGPPPPLRIGRHATKQIESLKTSLSPEGGVALSKSDQTHAGTQHFGGDLFAKGPRNTKALKLAGGDGAPIYEHQLVLSPRRVALLGWSSFGGGMQNVYVTVLDIAGTKPKRLQTVDYLTRRSTGCILVRAQGAELDLGIPKLPEVDFTPPELHLGRSTIPLSRLHYRPEIPEDAQAYCPPFHRDVLVDQVAWIRLGKAGFIKPPLKKIRRQRGPESD